MTSRDYLRALRRNALLLVACTLLSIGAAAGITAALTPVYEASARVYVSSAQSDTSDAYAGGLLSEQRVAAYVELVESRMLAQRVIDELGLSTTVPELQEQVSASVVNQTAVLEVRVRDGDPARASALAQELADQLVATSADIEAPVSGSESPTRVTVIDPAVQPEEPVAPRLMVNLALAAVFGLLLGAALALLREWLDSSITSVEDLGASAPPLLGSIPMDAGGRRRRLVTDLAPGAPRAEAFRVLRTNLQFVDVDSGRQRFVVTSAVEGEGKTSTAINLALTMAAAGVRVVLVDADLRRPRVAASLGVDGLVGVTTVLLGKVALDDAVVELADSSLHVLPSGIQPPNASELLQTQAMGHLLDELGDRYDVVLIDAPPLLPVTDAAVLANQCDGALVVVRHGRTTTEQWAGAVHRLERVRARAVGVVLTMVPSSDSAPGYSYGPAAAPAPQPDAGRRRRTREVA